MKNKQLLAGLVGALALLTSVSLQAGEVARHASSARTVHGHPGRADAREEQIQNRGSGLIRKLAETLGGLEKILALEGIRFMARGQQREPEQAVRPGGKPVRVVDYQYTLLNSFRKPQSRTDWLNEISYPFIEQRQFTEIINGNHGAILGFDTFISAGQAPMLSSRLGIRAKQNLISSPLALIHRAWRRAAEIRFVGKRKFRGKWHHVVSIPGWEQPVLMYIDSRNRRLSKVETWEDDTVYGDSRWEVIFDEWTEVDGLQLASHMTHRLNGRLINEESRHAFRLDADFGPAQFAIPAGLQAPFNADQFRWGTRMSQWFNRLLSAGIPFDLDQRTAATLQIVEVAPRVFHVRALSHHSMVIEMKDYLIMVEAPLYEARSQTVLDAVGKRWPDKPVKYLVATHFHNDHVGGIRAYGAIGATLIVGKGTKEHYEAIFEAPHRLYPDAYARVKHDTEVDIETVEVDEDMVLDDGLRKVRLFQVANRHAIGSVVAYVEDVKLLFTSDLYNPGFFVGRIPPRFLGWSEDLLRELEAGERDIETIVGGHGGVTGYEDFVRQVEASR